MANSHSLAKEYYESANLLISNDSQYDNILSILQIKGLSENDAKRVLNQCIASRRNKARFRLLVFLIVFILGLVISIYSLTDFQGGFVLLYGAVFWGGLKAFEASQDLKSLRKYP